MKQYKIFYKNKNTFSKFFITFKHEEFDTVVECYERAMELAFGEEKILQINIYKDNKEISYQELSDEYLLEKTPKVKQEEKIETQEKTKPLDDLINIAINYKNSQIVEMKLDKETLALKDVQNVMSIILDACQNDWDFYVEFEVFSRSISLLQSLRDMNHIKKFLTEVFDDSIKSGNIVIKL